MDLQLPPLPDRAAIDAAARLVHGVLPPTPQYAWPLLGAALAAEVWVKHENHTPVGAFKLRGGLVYMDALVRREPAVRGVISATRGNHGQSIAFAARRHGLRCVIAVPHGNSREKNAAMRALGAELLEHGHDFQAAREEAARHAATRGPALRAVVPPRPAAGRQHVLGRVLRRAAGARRGLRADRPGLGHLRRRRGAQRVRPAHARSSAWCRRVRPATRARWRRASRSRRR